MCNSDEHGSAERQELVRRMAVRFSVSAEQIEKLLEGREDLRDMCQEYATCQEAVQRWRSLSNTGHHRLAEFETLGRNLEDEITSVIQEQLPGQDG